MDVRRLKKTINIPTELVIDILARVPVKDLVRFICVCKRWSYLLATKKFIKEQLSYAPRRFLAIEDNKISPPRSILYEQVTKASPKMTLDEDDLSLTLGDKRLVEVDVIGHCDGLFCLKLQDRTLAVWNPLLKQVRKVFKKSTKPITYHDLIGFGYDHSIDDYKIVIFSALSETIMDPKHWSRGEIFSVKSSSRWNIGKVPKIRHCFDIRGTLAGSKLFWQVNCDPEKAVESETILSFDLLSEEFEYLSLPRNIKGLIQGLVSVQGCLGMVEDCRFQMRKKKVVWTASNDKSWSKFLIVDEYFDGFIGSQRLEAGLIGIYKKEHEKLNTYLQYEEAIRIFIYEEGKFIEVETNFKSSSYTLYDYVETLIALN